MHKIAKKVSKSASLFRYNVTRVVLMTLIRYGAEKREEPMSAAEALDTLVSLLGKIDLSF